VRRVHHGGMAVAALGLLVAVSGTWWELTLPTGATLAVSGLDASALASTLLASLAASYAAALLATGLLRRALGGLQAVLGAGVVFSWAAVLEDPISGQASAISTMTGLSGDQALLGVVSSGETGFVWLGLTAAALAAVSGVVGALAPDARPARSRFDRGGGPVSSDPIDTWDALSEGSDPTDR